jgi:hypothetical protein
MAAAAAAAPCEREAVLRRRVEAYFGGEPQAPRASAGGALEETPSCGLSGLPVKRSAQGMLADIRSLIREAARTRQVRITRDEHTWEG